MGRSPWWGLWNAFGAVRVVYLLARVVSLEHLKSAADMKRVLPPWFCARGSRCRRPPVPRWGKSGTRSFRSTRSPEANRKIPGSRSMARVVSSSFIAAGVRSSSSFDALGKRTGTEWPATSALRTAGDHGALAMDTRGDFVVALTGPETGRRSYHGIFGQRLGPTGIPVGGRFQVDAIPTATTTVHTRRADAPCSAMARDASFTVVWDSSFIGENASDVFGRRVRPWWPPHRQAAASGDTKRITHATLDHDGRRRRLRRGLAARPAGRFSRGSRCPRPALRQRRAASGERVSREHAHAAGSGRSDGGDGPQRRVCRGWQSADQDGDAEGIFAQRFDNAGADRVGVPRVNVHAEGSQLDPAVAVGVDGGFPRGMERP